MMASSSKSRLVRWRPTEWVIISDRPPYTAQELYTVVRKASGAIENAKASSMVEVRLRPKKDDTK